LCRAFILENAKLGKQVKDKKTMAVEALYI